MKKTATFTIDSDVWLAFNTTVQDRQRSPTVNSLLRNFLSIKNVDSSEQEIQENISILQEKMRELTTQLANESARLSALRQQQQKELHARMQAHDEFVKSGLMRTIR